MFENSSGYKIAEFGNNRYKVTIGGEKGDFPVVLVGSIFYQNHNVILDNISGKFDKKAAEEELNYFLELSEKSKIPGIIDVIGNSVKNLTSYCEFIADNSEVPFFVDGLNHSIRLGTSKNLIEIGLGERIIYNSIDGDTSLEVFEKIAEYGIKNAVILAFGNNTITSEQKINLLKGSKDRKGLIEKASNAGINNYIIDVAVLDIPSISIAAESIDKIKMRLKIPVGCAPVNALSQWENRHFFGLHGYEISQSAINTYILDAGANWILYGALNKAENTFPAIAMIDSINNYYRSHIERKNSKNHGFLNYLR